MERKIKKQWEMLARNKETDELETHTLSSYEVVEPPEDKIQELNDFFDIMRPEEREITRVRRRKVGETALRTLFVFGDCHIGYRQVGDEYVTTHDEKAMAVALAMMKDIKPDTVINLGDFMDFANLGKYEQDSNHFANTTQMALDRGFEYMSTIREALPEAKIFELQGNHDVRLKKLVAKSAFQLMGLKKAGTSEQDIFSYENLMGYDRIGVDYISGYPAGVFEYSEKLHFRHGSELKSNGSTAHKMSTAYQGTSVVQGHGHKIQTHKATRRNGETETYIMNGILGKNTGEIPSYGSAVDDRNKPVHKQEDWQQGVTVIIDHGDDFEHHSPEIKNGRAYYNGNRYTAKIEQNTEKIEKNEKN